MERGHWKRWKGPEGASGIAREDRIMNKARRMISLSAFVALVALGTGWALGTTLSNSRTQTGAAVSESAKASEPVTVSHDRKPLNAKPTDSRPEYDCSYRVLSQV